MAGALKQYEAALRDEIAKKGKAKPEWLQHCIDDCKRAKCDAERGTFFFSRAQNDLARRTDGERRRAWRRCRRCRVDGHLIDELPDATLGIRRSCQVFAVGMLRANAFRARAKLIEQGEKLLESMQGQGALVDKLSDLLKACVANMPEHGSSQFHVVQVVKPQKEKNELLTRRDGSLVSKTASRRSRRSVRGSRMPTCRPPRSSCSAGSSRARSSSR